MTSRLTKQPLHQALEGAWGIRQTTEAEGSFRVIFFCHWNLAITIGQVKCGEPVGSRKGIQGLLNLRQGKGILPALAIEEAVIHAQTQTPILLLNQDDG